MEGAVLPPLADREDQATQFGQGNEFGRRYRTQIGMGPVDQGFGLIRRVCGSIIPTQASHISPEMTARRQICLSISEASRTLAATLLGALKVA